MCVTNSPLTAGKLRIREAPFSLQECIETALEMIAPAAAEKELELAYRINCNGPDMVTGDARRLQQIMLNLLCMPLYALSGRTSTLAFSTPPC